MMNSILNNNPNVLVVGSGWAAKSFSSNIDKNKYNVTMISSETTFLYTPLLANFSVTKNIKNIDKDMSKCKDIKFINETVSDVDFKNQLLFTSKNNYKYDYIVFAHGSTINTFNIEGVKEHCLFLKSKNDAENIYKKLQTLDNDATVAVIGCGLTGSELIGSLIDCKRFNIIAIDALQTPLTMFARNNIDFTLDIWKKNNVKMYFNHFVKKVDDVGIYFKNNKQKYDLAIWCGGVKINPLSMLINKKIQLSSNKGILVDKYLKILNCHNAFAMGDCADSGELPTAQNANQQGIYLANRFNNYFNDNKEYVYSDKGKLCYIGNQNSIYESRLFSLSGKAGFYFGKLVHFINRNFN